VYDLGVLAKDEPDIRLLKKSILKLGYRAFFVNDRAEIEDSEWYRDYMLGLKFCKVCRTQGEASTTSRQQK
jgi:hypothetical protein